MPTYDHVRRRLVVCCDGTWQSSTSGERNIPSNVTRLIRHLAPSEVKTEVNPATGKEETTLWIQSAFYDPGIGTGDLSAADVNRQGGTGAGLAHNVIECYNWLVLNWQPGDKIHCFGFSRGAYTARALSGFIAELGICSRLDMQFFAEIYDLYEGALFPEKNEDTAEIKADRDKYLKKKALWESGGSVPFTLGDEAKGDTELQLATGPRNPISPESKKVEVVGVWDTVGSLGVPKIDGWFKIPAFFGGLDKPGRQFHDVRISDNVRHAFHALAMDERRKPFAPTLWYVPKGTTRGEGLSLKQVWFPGVHINAGGGSDDLLKERKSDAEQIAVVTFSWMIEQCRPFLAFDEASLMKGQTDQRALLAALGWETKTDNPASGWATGVIQDSFSEASVTIKLGGYHWREPGQTLQPENLVDQHEERTTKLGATFEEIHPSCYYRMIKLNKRSHGLDGFKRQACSDPKQGWEYVKKGEDGTMLRLPEYKIGKHPTEPGKPKNLERSLAEINRAGDFLKTLDDMYATGVDKTQSIDKITNLSV